LNGAETAEAEEKGSEYEERSSAMFSTDAAGPVASGLRRVAAEVTNEVVQLAWATISKLPDSTIRALSMAYGNFDRVVATGWLIADAVGLPLLERKGEQSAHAVGLKAKRVAISLKIDITAIQKAVKDMARKHNLAPDDPKRKELAREADEKESALLRAAVDLPLPAADEVAEGCSVPRKRARQSTQAELLAAASAELSSAKKSMASAEVEAATAEKRMWQAHNSWRVCHNIWSETPRPHLHMSVTECKRTMKVRQAAQDRTCAALAKWDTAVLASKDAEIGALHAKVEERNAYVGWLLQHAVV
jgi:hypothetical protein